MADKLNISPLPEPYKGKASFEKVSEEYMKMFGDAISTFDFDNNIEKCIEVMQKAIKEKKPYVSPLDGTDNIN